MTQPGPRGPKRVIEAAWRRIHDSEVRPKARTQLDRALEVLRAGDAAGALTMLELLMRESPHDPGVHAGLGWACRELGDEAAAARHAHTALSLETDVNSAHMLLATLELRGVDYLQVLARIHERLQPRTYFEIGVFMGKSIRLVGPRTDAIGIDPAPRLSCKLGTNCRIVTATSDEYFAARDLTAEFGGRPVELALIDGMHRCEFALRDFANIEPHCAPGATILIHDGHPLDETTSARERKTEFWTGDIWRAVLALRKYRPDVSVQTLASPPSGLTVVQRLDPSSRVLHGRMDEIADDMLAMDYGLLDGAKHEMLGVIPADWATVDALFTPATT